MAPALSGVWWGPEAGVVGSRAAADAGAAVVPANEHLLLVVALSVLTAVLLGSLLLLLCASCQGQKTAANTHVLGDHENLMNGLSERETASQSADSPQTDGAVSTSHNGPLTSGTILTETQDTSPQLSEEMLSSQSELRSSKCHQDRELPSIPPSNALIGEQPPASGDSPYEVVKEMVVGLRDVTTEDSLYETVKELKDPHVQPCPPNGTVIQPSPKEPPTHPAPILNGHVSPGTPERGPLCDGVEYASVDLKKKSRQSADMEAKRRSDHAGTPSHTALEAPEELPPPVPEKVLDENDNQPAVTNGLGGAGLQNGELHSPLSPGCNNHILSDNESTLFSTVYKTNCDSTVSEEDKEHDYSSIAEIKGMVTASSSSDLYATVQDFDTPPDETQPQHDPALESTDPGYETIRMPKSASSDDDHKASAEAERDAARQEPDYESVAELGLFPEMSRL
ncbi:phosphoprotein associated with glycosphingolipid-enriched microdomains 1 [Oryzias latipes]|uniref:Phosphoprotein membrane anchor with glycosphingolipid microdomains 1 n=1 Tax=Oryzias latipes TaxID=8090 RepID=A0A3B3IJC9_ORYLA|nr:phosphoprotein associated with glycosphingolipid-enriched microdomains 1 [Oryzias latipes]